MQHYGSVLNFIIEAKSGRCILGQLLGINGICKNTGKELKMMRGRDVQQKSEKACAEDSNFLLLQPYLVPSLKKKKVDIGLVVSFGSKGHNINQ